MRNQSTQERLLFTTSIAFYLSGEFHYDAKRGQKPLWTTAFATRSFALKTGRLTSFSEEELGSPVKQLVNGVTEKAGTLSLKSGLNAAAPAFVPPSARR